MPGPLYSCTSCTWQVRALGRVCVPLHVCTAVVCLPTLQSQGAWLQLWQQPAGRPSSGEARPHSAVMHLKAVDSECSQSCQVPTNGKMKLEAVKQGTQVQPA